MKTWWIDLEKTSSVNFSTKNDLLALKIQNKYLINRLREKVIKCLFGAKNDLFFYFYA